MIITDKNKINNEPNFDVETSVAYSMLEIFIRNVSQNNDITLMLTDAPGICMAYPQRKVIVLSKELAKNYGEDETRFAKALDSLPDDPKQLRALMESWTPQQIESIKNLSTNQLSNEELESMIVHEIGHISYRHAFHKINSPQQLHSFEFEADSTTYNSPTMKAGLIRRIKRAILDELISNGKEAYHKLANALLPCSACTHPSWDARLVRATSPLKEIAAYC